MQGEYVAPKGVKWDKLMSDIVGIVLVDGCDKSHVIDKIRNEIMNEKEKTLNDEKKMVHNENIRRLNNRNMQPVLPGSWRRMPYDLRVYTHIDEYVPSTNLLPDEQVEVLQQLDTSLYGYLGIHLLTHSLTYSLTHSRTYSLTYSLFLTHSGESYNYDDHDLTQQWVLTHLFTHLLTHLLTHLQASTLDISKLKKAKDSLITQLQIERLMDQLLQKVQDKVNNENGVLERPVIPIGPLLKEVAVFGIDCYTRRMVELVIEDRVKTGEIGTYRDITNYIEHKLLVSNTCSYLYLLTHSSSSHPLTYSLTHWLTYWLTYSLTHLLTYSLTHLLAYLLTLSHSLRWQSTDASPIKRTTC